MILKVNNCNSSSKKQSKRQKKMAANMEEKCPLCLDILEMDDLNFYPCKCGYQVCRFCWHRIRTNENGLCPACRRQYPEDPANFKPLSQEELQKLKSEKKMKEIQKKKEMAENRKQLANVRVLQKNLVFVHGLPVGIDADEERFRKLLHIFKEFGPVLKCVINNRTNYAGSQSPRASAYVTYQRIDDALKAYKSLPTRIEGHDVKTSLGTTKYCSNFLKNVHCPKQDCMYLHEIADDELCFTKDQIHAGDHLAFGNILYERMMAPPPQKTPQNSHSKETLTSEQELVTQAKPNSEVPTKVKEDSSSCSSDESSNSPMQSRLQHLFCNREPQNQMYVSELEMQFGCHIKSNPAVNNSPSSSSKSEQPVQRSLSSEESTLSSMVTNNVKNYQNFFAQKVPSIEEWLEHKTTTVGQSNGVHSNNHSHQNGVAANSGNSTSSILSRLTLHNSTNGTSNSLNSEFDFHSEDDDLGFDPLKISLEGLEDLVSSENKETLRMAAYKSAALDLQRQRASMPTVQQALNLLRARTPQQQQHQRQRNPPPGFSVNNFPSNQPLSSPVFESRNVLPTRMSPVINVSNSYNPVRANYQVPRFPSVSLNSNSLMNGFTSQQPVRNMSPQTIPLQAQAMHELLSRSTPTSQHQHVQTQSQNLSQTQYPPSVDQNLSPSFWSMNQSQWMQAENSFQNQSMTDFRPASPLLNLRRMQSQQLRPATDYSRQMHQLTARYNNLSPFSENPQFMYPNNSQHNQLAKGVHTFP